MKTLAKRLRPVFGPGPPTGPVLGLLLALLAFLALLPVLQNGYIAIDDPAYVTANQEVRRGLTREGVGWAFSSFHSSNWHPLTWLSHMADAQFFGSSPRGPHLVNLLLHVANTLMVFLLLRRATGNLGRSAFAAAVFAVHPLHVESVGWVSERKDVLSAFAGLLTMAAYDRYLRRPRTARFLPVIALFIVGLLSKPMLVTLPFVLLLVDYWPYGHLRGSSSMARLVKEKIPLFVLSAASSMVTYAAQQSSGIVKTLGSYSLEVRIANALISYATYLIKLLWPHDLALPYHHPGEGISRPSAAAALLLLLALSALVAALHRRQPFLSVGWLWFLGTLVPVIGLVQVSDQAMADRYAYLPSLGIFIALAWGSGGPLAGHPRARAPAAALAAAVVLALGAETVAQARLWRDDAILFRHAVAIDPGNFLALALLGQAEIARGDLRGGIAHYETAVRLSPYFLNARVNLADAYLEEGRVGDAVTQLSFVIERKPRHVDARITLGMALDKLGRRREAMAQFSEALRHDPKNPRLWWMHRPP